MSKVTIELTSEQRAQIKKETGEELQAFTYEVLENRDAPKMGGVAGFIKSGGDPQDIPLQRGGGISITDPTVS